MQSQFSETDLEAKHKWIYVVVPLSVGPVGPRGGIYSIIEDVVCKEYFQKQTLHTTLSTIEYIPPPGPTGPTDINKTGYIQDCLVSRSVLS